MLGNEGLQYVFYPVSNYPALRSPLFSRRIAPFESSRKHLLCRNPRLMQRHTPIRADCVLAQLRARTAGSVQHDENLAARWGDLHTKARAAGIPVHGVSCWRP